MTKHPIYDPREDSYLLLEEIQKQKNIENALDIGTGSGILALELAKIAQRVTAADINKETLNELNKNIKLHRIKNLKTINSDLFSRVSGKFDLIVFNPPYIPTGKIKFIDLDGGKNGTQVIERFLKNARKYLSKNGKILLLTSSLNKNMRKMFEDYHFNAKKIAEKKIFFEKLFIWELK